MNDNLKAYPLPEHIVSMLGKIDELAQRRARAGYKVPAVIALADVDFDAVDAVVRRASGETITAWKVQWNGRPLSRAVLSRVRAA